MITEQGIILEKNFSKIREPELAEAVLHVYCLAGTCSFFYQGRYLDIHPHDEVSIQASHWSEIRMSDDFDAKMFYVTLGLSKEAMVSDRYFTQYVVHRYQNPVVHLVGPERQRCFQCFLDIESATYYSNKSYSRAIQINVVQRFFMELNDILVAHYAVPEPQHSTQMGRIMQRFLELIYENCSQQRDVAWYASELCISRKYLTQVSQTVSNRPPNFWIDLFTTREICIKLANPDLSIRQIADHFNFTTQTYFSRYFKKQLGGVSPTDYRDAMF